MICLTPEHLLCIYSSGIAKFEKHLHLWVDGALDIYLVFNVISISMSKNDSALNEIQIVVSIFLSA